MSYTYIQRHSTKLIQSKECSLYNLAEQYDIDILFIFLKEAGSYMFNSIFVYFVFEELISLDTMKVNFDDLRFEFSY